jgi:RNA polymerase sigma-70 factor, ECF subfamily
MQLHHSGDLATQLCYDVVHMASTQILSDDSTADQSARLLALMLQVKARDRAAFAEVYELTVAKVFGLAKAMLRIPADAEELVVDVYERAWHSASSYDETRGSVFAWLLIMCRSRGLDILRQRKTRAEHHEALANEATDTFDEASPVRLLDTFQQGHAVHRALAKLSDVRRQMIALAFFEELSHQEIAARLSMPLGTVKSHVKRAIQELRVLLDCRETGYDEAH